MNEEVLAGFLILAVVGLIVALIVRPFVLWYFRISERAQTQEKILATLRAMRDSQQHPEN